MGDGARVEIAAARRTPTHPGVPHVLINGKEFTSIDDTQALRKAICDAMPPKDDVNAAALKTCEQKFEERYPSRGGSVGSGLSVDGAKRALKYAAEKVGSIFKL